MKYIALATDYDGTIATHGTVDPETLNCLKRFKEEGRKLILVTGREMHDLTRAFPHPLELFDRIVAENGATLYRPQTGEEELLAKSPPPEFASLLRERGVAGLSLGRVIVATHEPYESVVIGAIRDLSLELQVIFNKGSVMILPSGVNKASGLRVALSELKLLPGEVVAVGDAENDHACFECCGFSAAVGNALPALKEKADLVLEGRHGLGVAELIAKMLDGNLEKATPAVRG